MKSIISLGGDTRKVTPTSNVVSTKSSRKELKLQEKKRQVNNRSLVMKFMSLSVLKNRYGGQKRPRLKSYEFHERQGELLEWQFIPAKSTTIYISHEWNGMSSPFFLLSFIKHTSKHKSLTFHGLTCKLQNKKKTHINKIIALPQDSSIPILTEIKQIILYVNYLDFRRVIFPK